MMKMYELEQQILNTWSIIDDLKLVLDLTESDKIEKILIGIIELNNLKFEKMFNCYEEVLKELRVRNNAN